MAHHSTSKFPSTNLTRSYGNQTPSPHGRGRGGAGPHHYHHNTSGGGMVLLSRSRGGGGFAATKSAAPKLSVPPPLNLPSLRKEHERFDPASSGPAARSGPGLGSGPSGPTGWTKPTQAPTTPAVTTTTDRGKDVTTSAGQAGPVVVGPTLRGEDFPSLRASVASPASVPKPKDKDDVSLQITRRKGNSDGLDARLGTPDMRPQVRLPSSSSSRGGGSVGNEELERRPGSGRNDVLVSGPLPIVKLRYELEWADDERDTGLSLPERRSEVVVPVRDAYGREVFKRDVGGIGGGGGQDGSWRSPAMNYRDRLGGPEVGIDRERPDGRPFSAGRGTGQSNFRDGLSGTMKNSWNVRRDLVHNVGTEESGRERYGDSSNSWFRGNSFQNNHYNNHAVSKAQPLLVNKGPMFGEPVVNYGREKGVASSPAKPVYVEDDGFDSIADVNVKVFKKKKEAQKQVDFHDPARESFEAELDRILRDQEQERLRAMEEQARAVEFVRREEEERERLIREEEERRRLVEEEARHAAWQAEQETMEAARKAEEQRIARDEEKRRMLMEEERRKEAARQKLLELELRMARRQAEGNTRDERLPSAGEERVPAVIKDKDMPRAANFVDREDGDRMGERISNSASSDSSSFNRYIDTVPRLQTSRDGHPPFGDRGDLAYYGARAPFQDQESMHRSPRRDAFGTRRGFSQKDTHDGFGTMPFGPSSKRGTAESSWMPDDYRHGRVPRWDAPRENDRFDRQQADFDAEYLSSDRFGDAGWLASSSHGSPGAQHGERSFLNSEATGFSAFTKSRYSVRQPRVLPPPSVSTMHRSSIGPASQHASSSTFMDGDASQRAVRNDTQSMQGQYGSVYQEAPQQQGPSVAVQDSSIHREQNEEEAPRIGSQSSLSVSSPPSSPPHISHDEMDVSGDSPALPTSADGDQNLMSDNDHVASPVDAVDTSRLVTASTVSNVEDDGWTSENNEDMQQQDEYEDEGDGYQEDEINEGDDENINLDEEFAGLHLEGQNETGEMEQFILGFDEGVQVQIPTNNELDLASQNTDKAIVAQEKGIAMQVSSTSVLGEEIGSGVNVHSKDTVDDRSGLVMKAEKAMQGLGVDQVASTSYVSKTETFTSSGVPAQAIGPSMSSFPLPSASSAGPIISSSPAVARQTEVPLNLQFGLFSSPPLIPSPIPAIQIGSIQMPIHLHTQIGTSVTQMHPSSAPLFQFGQLRYPHPISQNVGTIPSQPMSFVGSSAPAPYLLHQNPTSSLPNQINRGPYQSAQPDRMSNSLDKAAGPATKMSRHPQHSSTSQQLNATANNQKEDAEILPGQPDTPFGENTNSALLQIEHNRNHDHSLKKNFKHGSSNKESRSQLHDDFQSSQFASERKAPVGPKAPGAVSSGRGRRYSYAIRDPNSRYSASNMENSQKDPRGFQRRGRRNIRRTEFRVRENVERTQMQADESFNNGEQDERLNANDRTPGFSVRNVSRREGDMNKFSRIVNEPSNASSGPSTSGAANSDGNEKAAVEVTQKGSCLENPHGVKQSYRTNAVIEGGPGPSQSGVVHVFKQQGIEVPVDADGFIEVRSKKQIMNVRREQREKENKTKLRMAKASRRQHAVSVSYSSSLNLNKSTAPISGEAAQKVASESAILGGRDPGNVEASLPVKGSTASPSLPPIGPPSLNKESHKNYYVKKSSQIQSASEPVTSVTGAKLVQAIISESKSVSVNPPLTLGSWDGPQINQQVMPLTQTQLEEAMKPAKFEQQAGNFPLESNNSMTSVLTQEKPFPSSPSPINSLLAGEKIQFGAVTSPPILPPVSRAVSNGLGAPGSSRPDVKFERGLPVANSDSMMFFDKEKSNEEAPPNLEDVQAEAEAEAAASAVAVAAISNDELVGSTINPSTASASESTSFSNTEVTGLTSAGLATSEIAQSSAEESLTVALPADLSVDTPALSLWPALPSPQGSGPMISQFPGVQPSHFSCFEMNPMLGGQIFAYGPDDESAGTHGHPQRSNPLPSGPLGAWPQLHSGVDSFYHAPTGFTGPFISPGGIPGVQGHPHMVVYNHFTPVGQFSQMGLGFMGPAYIPGEKQTDWKHNQLVGVNQGDLNNQGMVSGQGTSSSAPAPMQHMRPTSSLMPMPSPLPIFDIPPFHQPPPDIQMQTCWSHLPVPSLHSVPLSVPLQQHPVDGGTPQFHPNLPKDNKATSNNRFPEPPPSVSAEGNRTFPNKTAACQLPDELGLVEQLVPSGSSTQTIQPSFSRISGNNNEALNRTKVTSRSNPPIANTNIVSGTTSSISGGGQPVNVSSKTQQPLPLDQQHHHPVGNPDRRGRGSQKTGSGNEWHRRSGFLGRNHGTGADKNFGTGRMKQMYVAKQPPTSGTSASGLDGNH